MTVREMEKLFENLVNQYDKNIGDKLQTDQISIFLNHAQTKIVNREFVERDLQTDRKEVNAKLAKFRKLTQVEKAITPAVSNLTGIPNSEFFELSGVSDFMYYIFSTSNVTRTDKPSANFVVENELTEIQQIKDFINNDFNKPYIRSPKAAILEEGIVTVHDSETTINNIDLYYLRIPKKMTSFAIAGVYTDYVNTCELPEEMHEEIVEIAVKSAIAVKDPAKYEIALNETRETNQ